MQCIVTYAIGMYFWLSKISPEITVFNTGYQSAGQSILQWARMWGSVVICRRGVREQTSLGNSGL